MDLEDRVRALEYEVKILKHEILEMLVDLQDQVPARAVPAGMREGRGQSNGNRATRKATLDEIRAHYRRGADGHAPDDEEQDT